PSVSASCRSKLLIWCRWIPRVGAPQTVMTAMPVWVAQWELWTSMPALVSCLVLSARLAVAGSHCLLPSGLWMWVWVGGGGVQAVVARRRGGGRVGGGVVWAGVARRRVRVRVFVFIGAARFVVGWGHCGRPGGAGVGGGLPPLPVPLLAPSGGSPFGPACGCSALRLSREGRGVRSCGGDGLCAYKNPGAWPGFLLVRGGFSLPRPVRCGTCASRRRLRSSRPGTRSSGRRGRRVPGAAS